ncbi:MAG: hypothetical protein CMJ67_10070 [Planctomycetaceae bacterium]|nr:hypothetical protein [Planctomycetaceae bacterium]
MTPLLFHGPLARGEAVAHARSLGRLLGDPIGDTGLKVDDSREIVRLAGNAGVGDKPPVLVVGPLDRATPEAVDGLLKTLEDLADGPVRILLWADFYGGVIGTIRSRTLDRWCPPDERWTSPFMDDNARALYRAWSKKDVATCLSVIHASQRDWAALLHGFCEFIVEEHPDLGSPETTAVWNHVRPLLDGRGSHLCAAAALLEAM